MLKCVISNITLNICLVMSRWHLGLCVTAHFYSGKRFQMYKSGHQAILTSLINSTKINKWPETAMKETKWSKLSQLLHYVTNSCLLRVTQRRDRFAFMHWLTKWLLERRHTVWSPHCSDTLITVIMSSPFELALYTHPKFQILQLCKHNWFTGLNLSLCSYCVSRSHFSFV